MGSVHENSCKLRSGLPFLHSAPQQGVPLHEKHQNMKELLVDIHVISVILKEMAQMPLKINRIKIRKGSISMCDECSKN